MISTYTEKFTRKKASREGRKERMASKVSDDVESIVEGYDNHEMVGLMRMSLTVLVLLKEHAHVIRDSFFNVLLFHNIHTIIAKTDGV